MRLSVRCNMSVMAAQWIVSADDGKWVSHERNICEALSFARQKIPFARHNFEAILPPRHERSSAVVDTSRAELASILFNGWIAAIYTHSTNGPVVRVPTRVEGTNSLDRSISSSATTRCTSIAICHVHSEQSMNGRRALLTPLAISKITLW